MEEVMGVKVKKPVDEVETVEETTEVTEDTAPVIEDVTEETKVDENSVPENNFDINDDTSAQQQIYDEFDEKPYVKVATARLLSSDGATIYRFDITHKDVDENNGVIELKNIVNNFDAIRPENEKGYKNFFTLMGIIAFNFPTAVMSYNQNILATITQLESLLNQHLHIAGFRESEYRFRIDTVIED